MKILFKVSNYGADEPLVNHSNFAEHYASVNGNTAWKTLLPTLKRTTREVLIPRISRELYNDLADKYDTGAVLTDEQTDILECCQDVVAYWSMLSLPSELLITISNMGVVEKGSNNSPVNPVAQWRYKEFKYQLTIKADKALDQLISRLDQMVENEVAYFDLYKDSDAYAQNKTSFFDSAEEFDVYVKIGKSRRLFDAIYQDILRCEEDVDKIICEDQFSALVTMLRAGDDPDPIFKTLIEKIRRYVSSKALSYAAARLYLQLDTHGLSLSSYTDGFSTLNHHSYAFKGAEAVSAYVNRLEKDADIYFKDLSNFINDNIESLPLIKDSDCYVSYTTGGNYPIYVGPGGVFI